MTNTRKGEQGALAEPDLQIRGEGGGRSSRPWNKEEEGGQSLKIYFSALRASVWYKNKWGPAPPVLPSGSSTGEWGSTENERTNSNLNQRSNDCLPTMHWNTKYIITSFVKSSVQASSRQCSIKMTGSYGKFGKPDVLVEWKPSSISNCLSVLFPFFTSISLLPVPRFSNIPPGCSVKCLSYVSSLGRPFWTFRRFPH